MFILLYFLRYTYAFIIIFSDFVKYLTPWIHDFRALSQLTTSRSPPLSVLIRLSLKMRNMLNRMRKIIKKFSDFFSRVIVRISLKIWAMTSKEWPKSDHNSKNKNRKNLKFNFSFDSADVRTFLNIFKIYMKDTESAELK